MASRMPGFKNLSSSLPSPSSSKKKSKKRLLSSLDMNIERAFTDISRKHNRNKNKRRPQLTLPTALNYDSIPSPDPKLFTMKPLVDLSSFRPSEPSAVTVDSNINGNTESSRIDLTLDDNDEIKIETSENSEADILKAIHKDNYTEEELNLLLQAVKSGTETRLPFKKRRMAVPEEKTPEISYPATPMVSIAELAVIQPNLSNDGLLPVHNGRAYLSEMPLETAPVGVEVNYSLNAVNAYSYNFMPCAPAYFEMNAQQPVEYCLGVDALGFDSKENVDMNLHYFRSESIEP